MSWFQSLKRGMLLGLWSKSPSVNLAALRDLLLPSLRMINGQNPDVELSIRLDYTTGSLLVIGNRNGIELGFAITDGEIRDRRYLAEFTPNVRRLIERLRAPVLLETKVRLADRCTEEVLS